MKTILGVGLVAVFFSAGCHGFPTPIPIADAEHKPEKYVTYSGSPAAQLAVGQQRWMILPGAVVGAPASVFQATTGSPLLRAAWDDAPYDLLYGRGTDGLLRMAAEIR